MGVGKTTFTFSNSAITIDGGSTNINLTRDNQSYTNKLSHGYGDIYTFPAGVTDYAWEPTATQLTKFFEEIPALSKRQIDVYLDTYNGSTKVGRDVHSLSVTLSEATGKPEITKFTLADVNNTTSSWGIIVKGVSSVLASVGRGAKYGAKISSDVYTCDYNNTHYESSDFGSFLAMLPLTTTPTQYTIGYKVTDSRGFSTTKTLTKNIAQYQAPHIEDFEVTRCNTSGTADENGTKAKVVVKGSWAAMKVGTAYKNAGTLKVGYRTAGSTDAYTFQSISVSGGTVDVSQLLDATFTASTDYEFSVILSDALSYSDSVSDIGFSNGGNIIYVSPDGNELIIGSKSGNNVSIDEDSLDLRDKSTVLASFGVDSDKNAVIQSDKDLYLIAGMGSKTVGITSLVDDKPSGYGIAVTNDEGLYDVTLISSTVSIRSYKKPLQICSGYTPDGTEYQEGDLNDWVIAKGQSGNWTYRKWASGIAECWGAFGYNCTCDMAWNWGYYGHSIGSEALPFTFIATTGKYPQANVTVSSPSGDYWFDVSERCTATKGPKGFVVSHGKYDTANYTELFISVKGWWK